jgi:hypothetical protein
MHSLLAEQQDRIRSRARSSFPAEVYVPKASSRFTRFVSGLGTPETPFAGYTTDASRLCCYLRESVNKSMP